MEWIGCSMSALGSATAPPSLSTGQHLPQRHRAEQGSKPMQTDHRRLLIVDNDHVKRDILAHELERQGYSVACAAGRSQAMELITTYAFDLVLGDLAQSLFEHGDNEGQIRAVKPLQQPLGSVLQ